MSISPICGKQLGLTRAEFHDLGRENMGGLRPVQHAGAGAALRPPLPTPSASFTASVSRAMWQWLYPECAGT